MKKLISIGIALALLAIAIVPGAVAAQTDCAYDTPGYGDGYIEPDTYAKIPFAIIESGLWMVGDMMGSLQTILEAAGFGLPLDLSDVSPVLFSIAGFAGGPLSWTVDFLGWGVGMLSPLLGGLADAGLGIPTWVGDLVDAIVCHIFAPFDCVEGTTWDPCA